MKNWFSALMLIAPMAVMAATPAAPAAKPAPNKQAASKPVAKNNKPSSSAKTQQVAAKPKPAKPARKAAAVAAGATAGAAVAAAPALATTRTLGPDEMAVADRVYTGRIACELGQHVEVAKDVRNPGHFNVTGKGFNFHMTPVGTTTGVVRLEDEKSGAVWLQIANKSMLMNQKQGKRLADECMSPEQLQVAEVIKKNPPQSLLDAPAK